jgi:putative endonuclease
MQTVYILKSEKDFKWYIGCTADLGKRISEHNEGRVLSTKSRRPFILLYAEEFSDKYEAFRMERFYKSVKGKRILKSKIAHCRVV